MHPSIVAPEPVSFDSESANTHTYRRYYAAASFGRKLVLSLAVAVRDHGGMHQRQKDGVSSK